MADETQSRDARMVAEMDGDIGAEQVADVYAEALLGAAESVSASDETLEEFDSLVRDILDRFPQFEGVLASELLSYEEKSGILDRTLGGRASDVMMRFLNVVARHGRLDLLRLIHRRTHAMDAVRRGRVPVVVTTASPLAEETLDRLRGELRRILQREPVVSSVVDPDVIGGVVVRVGDTLFDGSVAAGLENLRRQMIDRSAHEIQSRRDRFRNPAGN